MSPLVTLLNQLGQPRLLVIGDLILDRYTWGNAERISPEAPVLVFEADFSEVRTGGAASVAVVSKTLDAEVVLAGAIGDDLDGRTLTRLLTGAQFLVPNRFEAQHASGITILTPHDAFLTGRRLCLQHNIGTVIVKLDREGMVLTHGDDDFQFFPTRPRDVYDITGAGDAVLATLGICIAEGLTLTDSLKLANHAAGLQVERWGVSPITRDELRAELTRGARPSSNKVKTLDELAPLVDAYRQQGQTILFTNGCFDLLHIGHVSTLQQAAALGDVLIVAVNSDASVRQLKGSERPIIGQLDRVAILAALDCVDHVILLEDDTPNRLLTQICPDVLAKGGTTAEIVGREIVEAYGGTVCHLDSREGQSTTRIVKRITTGLVDEKERVSAIRRANDHPIFG